jgi:feruloyl esterase
VATKVAGGTTTMSRPLCPYPQKAVYSGSGNPNDAQSFACRP